VQGIEAAEALTANNTGLQLTIALDYGGRQDIVAAVRQLVVRGVAPDDITEETLASCLQTQGLPDPDLLVRTSGEQRLSNFLLWPSAYTELFFTPTLWPDFGEATWHEALQVYAQRQRRFGGIVPAQQAQQHGG